MTTTAEVHDSAVSHISLLAVAVAAITSGTGQSYRQLKAVKRIA